jgi:hypothetical protein
MLSAVRMIGVIPLLLSLLFAKRLIAEAAKHHGL